MLACEIYLWTWRSFKKQMLPTVYPGASDEMKNCGPAMFPTQYSMKINEITVVFLVKPATFDVTSDRDNGRFATKAVVRQKPAWRASGWALEIPNIIAKLFV
jgi:hypothetical protein